MTRDPMELTAANVHGTMKYCLAPDGPTSPDHKTVEGAVNVFRFSQTKLAEKHEDIVAMLGQLPRQFRASIGGGWSFLKAACRADGVHWGEHPSMEALFALGLGVNAVYELLPRDMWDVLPGSMPYYAIRD